MASKLKVKVRMTWRKQPYQTGLRAIGEGPRGAILRADGDDVGRVYPHGGGHRGAVTGWYWVARDDRRGVPLMNTHGESMPTIDEAKAACAAYVRACLEREAVK